jgi:integrase
VAPNGGKTWELAYRIKGAGVKRRSLGRCDDVSLDAARARAAAITRDGRLGVDTAAEERAIAEERARLVTVGQLIDRYFAERITGRLRTAAKTGAALRRALAPLAGKPALTVTRSNLAGILSAMKPRAAGLARSLISTMFRWAISQSLIDRNPCDGLPTYSAGKPRDRVLDHDEIRTLWAWLKTSTLTPAMVDALKLQLLIGARIGEIAGIKPGELSMTPNGRMIWTLPAERSKNGKPRVTPIVGAARAILERRQEFRSATGGPINSTLIGACLASRRHAIPIAAFTSHDLRRTVVGEMAEIGVPLELIAAIIGHSLAIKRETMVLVRHYFHKDLIERKTRALADWDRRLSEILAGEQATNIIALKHPPTG